VLELIVQMVGAGTVSVLRKIAFATDLHGFGADTCTVSVQTIFGRHVFNATLCWG
jgi:hypothetical protein